MTDVQTHSGKSQVQLALSGSGFLLPVHVGALQAIHAGGFEISVLSGTSGGAIVGALYAVDPNPDLLAEWVLSTDWQPFMNFWSITNGWRLFWSRGICATGVLDAYLNQHTKSKTFADVALDLKVCATDLDRGERAEFSRKTTPSLTLAEAARASSSLPFVYPPKRIAETLYVDGGLTDDIPGNLLPQNAEIPSVGVYLTGPTPKPSGKEPTLFSLASLSLGSLMRSQEYLDRHAAPWVRFAGVDTGDANMLSYEGAVDEPRARCDGAVIGNALDLLAPFLLFRD